jgi:glutathione S-transferase
MLKILGKAPSINVRKVLWTCAEIGLPYELDEWGLGTSRPAPTPEFLALNPHGLVPVLVDGDAVLWESNTICRYLAGRHQRSDLLPTEPLARAHVEKWMDWQATDLNASWRYAFMALVRRHPDFTDAAAIAASAAAWNRQMASLDAQLAVTGAYAAGGAFTLADVVLGVSVQRWLSTPIDHADLPAVRAYYDRLRQRPAFVSHAATHP